MDERTIVRKPRSKKPYINGTDFYNALVSYYESCAKAESEGKTQPRMSNYIGECIYKISYNMSSKSNFALYTFKEEMISDAVVKMVEAVELKKFDPEQSRNPFAYFSQICWNCFVTRIITENRETYIKHKNIQHMVIFDEASMLDEGGLNNEEHMKVISDFEKPKEKKTGYVKHRNLSYSKNRRRKKDANESYDSNENKKEEENE
jgi:hypothetical protein